MARLRPGGAGMTVHQAFGDRYAKPLNSKSGEDVSLTSPKSWDIRRAALRPGTVGTRPDMLPTISSGFDAAQRNILEFSKIRRPRLNRGTRVLFADRMELIGAHRLDFMVNPSIRVNVVSQAAGIARVKIDEGSEHGRGMAGTKHAGCDAERADNVCVQFELYGPSLKCRTRVPFGAFFR